MRIGPAAKWIGRAALALALAWALALGAALAARRALIYPFATDPAAGVPSRLSAASERRVEAADGTPLTVWVVPPRAGRPVVLILTGNVGHVADVSWLAADFAAEGWGVVLPLYRGAAGRPGAPSEVALTADALAVHDALGALLEADLPPRPLVVYGRSLGGAVAVQLAVRRPVGALILENPFDRLCEVVEDRFPFLPACAVMWDERWESAAAIPAVEAATLVLSGGADRVIEPARHAALFDAATEPKRLIRYAGGSHFDLRLRGGVRDAIAFVEGRTP